MKAEGSFDVELSPQDDIGHAAGRMLIDKVYKGDLAGSGLGQMLSKRTADGESVYSAVEEFTGTLDGKTGGFTLFHNGRMSTDGQSLSITIVAGSGSGDLVGITGTMDLSIVDGKHNYVLQYQL